MRINSRPQLALLPLLVMAGTVFALTGGPAMPEYAKFEQVGADNLVDPNTGNFNYVIPLIEVPGPGGKYPLSLSYQSGIQHGQEASWVGLGWTLNAGNINRVTRGVPDDYLNGLSTTWNKFSASGEQINVNVGYGGFGLSMSFDANSGSFMGATPSYSLPIPGPLGVSLTPNGFTIGISHSVGLVAANLTLYDSQTGSSGKVGWSVAGISGAKSVGVTAGGGQTSVSSIGGSLPPIAGFSLGFGYTKWKFVLDEHIDDHMCGFLFQDGNRNNYVNTDEYWYPSSGAMPKPYIKGTGNASGVTEGLGTQDSPRQRYERSMMKDLLFPSADMFTVSANGLGGSFEPMVEPAPSAGMSLPEYLDGGLSSDPGNRDNEGWYVKNPASLSNITFRMHGDPGGNLVQLGTRPPSQINPYIWDYTVDGSGNRVAKLFGDQYGSQRIVPVFEKSASAPGKFKSGLLKGFRVFNPDGMIYEFLKPLHTVFSADMVFEHDKQPTTNNSIKYMPDKYAYTWLLTAVKGADFVSQSSLPSWEASPAAGDMGHWVVFKYPTEPRQTTFATPYSGNMPHEDGALNPSSSKLKYLKSFGVKEVAFLSSIETESHRAEFVTEARLDALPNPKNIWEFATTAPDNVARNDAADQFVSARGVPRKTDFSSNPQSDFDWTDNFEIPGNWEALIEDCLLRFPNNHGNCVSVEVEARLLEGGGFQDYFYGTRVVRETSIARISNVSLTAAGNTTFTAFVRIDFDSDQECDWLRVNRAGVNWSRLYAILGQSIDLASLTPGLADGALPLVVNRALKKINLYRKGVAGHPEAMVKAIDFGYDYSLCPGTPNSVGGNGGPPTKGKLTLRSVTTSAPDDENSETTEIQKPYEFSYQGEMGDLDGNPAFGDEYKKDVWGMYKKDGASNQHLVTQPPLNGSYPDPDVQAAPGVAWNLAKVKTPTGGTIRLRYTRDQYWIAGMWKSPISNDRYLLPDLYTNAPPQLANGDLDVSQLLEVQAPYLNTTDPVVHDREPIQLGTVMLTASEMAFGKHFNNGGQALNLRKYPEGPAKPNVIKFVQNPAGVNRGDILLVVYRLLETKANPDNLLTTGVLNLVFVEDIINGEYKIKPLLTADPSGNFYVYKKMTTNSTGAFDDYDFEFKYYAYRFNSRKVIYGGDVAVTRIDLNDGLGNTLTKKYEYDALDLRSGTGQKGIANICTGCGTASGATFGLPSMYWAKYYRFIPVAATPQVPGPGKLRLETFMDLHPANGGNRFIHRTDPKIMSDMAGTSWNENPMKNLLEEAFFAEDMDGGNYFPAPGIAYARTREYYLGQTGGPSPGQKLSGETEYQFHGLNHAMVNEGTALGALSNIVAGDQWYTSAVKAAAGADGSLNVTNKWASKKGAMARILKRSSESGNPIVNWQEMKYAELVTLYSGPNSADIKTDAHPGWIQQSHVSNVRGLRTTINVLHAPNITVGKTEAEYNTRAETDYLAFDPRTGEPLAIKKGMPDGTSMVEYQEPAYWSLDDMAIRNRFKVNTEERKYMLGSGVSFARTDLAKIISANKTIWSSDYNGYWKNHPTHGSKPRPPLAVAEYCWSQGISNSTGTATNAYYPFLGFPDGKWLSNKGISYVWKNSQPIQTRNGMGGLSLIIPSIHTGHPMAVVSGASYDQVIVSTFQFEEDGNSRFADHELWSGGSDFGLGAPRFDFTTASYRIGPNTTRSRIVNLNTAGRRGLLISFHPSSVGSSLAKIRVTPLSWDGTALAGVTPFLTDVASDAASGRMEIELDWSLHPWTGASKARIDFVTPASTTLYLNDLRVTPRDALVNTYYYQPETFSTTAVIDESGRISRFRYDRLGRLTEKRNADNQVLEKTTYQNYQD